MPPAMYTPPAGGGGQHVAHHDRSPSPSSRRILRGGGAAACPCPCPCSACGGGQRRTSKGTPRVSAAPMLHQAPAPRLCLWPGIAPTLHPALAPTLTFLARHCTHTAPRPRPFTLGQAPQRHGARLRAYNAQKHVHRLNRYGVGAIKRSPGNLCGRLRGLRGGGGGGGLGRGDGMGLAGLLAAGPSAGPSRDTAYIPSNPKTHAITTGSAASACTSRGCRRGLGRTHVLLLPSCAPSPSLYPWRSGPSPLAAAP